MLRRWRICSRTGRVHRLGPLRPHHQNLSGPALSTASALQELGGTQGILGVALSELDPRVLIFSGSVKCDQKNGAKVAGAISRERSIIAELLSIDRGTGRADTDGLDAVPAFRNWVVFSPRASVAFAILDAVKGSFPAAQP